MKMILTQTLWLFLAIKNNLNIKAASATVEAAFIF